MGDVLVTLHGPTFDSLPPLYSFIWIREAHSKYSCIIEMALWIILDEGGIKRGRYVKHHHNTEDIFPFD